MSRGPASGMQMTDPVLIVRVGAFGDVLHALPAVAALRLARQEIEIDWVIDPRWSPLLVNSAGAGPVVSRVHLAETRLWSRAPLSRETLRSVARLRSAVRARRYGAVVDVQGTLRSAVIGSFASAKVYAGFRAPRERAAAWFYRQHIARKGEHVVQQNATLLGEALGVALTPAVTELPREPWAESWAGELVGSDRAVVLSPSAGWGAKRWPIERYAALARALRAEGLRVLVNALRADDSVANALAGASGGAAETVVCDVTGLIALVRRAALVVGGDSGPVHLAAALGTPVVALFGATDPARNGPFGPGPAQVLRHPDSVTSYKRREEPDPGLVQLAASEVFEAVRATGALS